MTTAGETSGNPFPRIVQTAPSGGATLGQTYVLRDNPVVALTTAAAGFPFDACVGGPVWAAKSTAVSIEASAKVFLDTATGLLTSDATKTEIGAYALAQASTSDGAVRIMLGQPIAANVGKVVALTDAATIATDASLGDIFAVTLAASRTMGAPTNAKDGKRIAYRITQGGTGSNTITWNAAFRFSTDLASPTLTTTLAATDYVVFGYNAAASKWDCLAVNRGF